jgi:hypothetical protein
VRENNVKTIIFLLSFCSGRTLHQADKDNTVNARKSTIFKRLLSLNYLLVNDFKVNFFYIRYKSLGNIKNDYSYKNDSKKFVLLPRKDTLKVIAWTLGAYSLCYSLVHA